ncbi:F-box domain protein [Necator americanus]|uniref:F-box domain protein n=1 Tax=Necator americanus TaxID=51031 RepID=W2TYV9_NECAM|nr:F-box domain protein [Necator americanus]ETN86222.1 F-box domain protein [Necator americanus]
MIKWTELPGEIIHIVCDYLSFSERRTFSMINRRCRQIINARREKMAGVIVRGMPSINYYYIDIAFIDGSHLRKEFSCSYCGTTDVKTVLTDYSNPFGSCHNGRIRKVTPYQLMAMYFKCILQRSSVDTLYIGLVDVVPLLQLVDCRVNTIVLPDESETEDIRRLGQSPNTVMTRVL